MTFWYVLYSINAHFSQDIGVFCTILCISRIRITILYIINPEISDLLTIQSQRD